MSRPMSSTSLNSDSALEVMVRSAASEEVFRADLEAEQQEEEARVWRELSEHLEEVPSEAPSEAPLEAPSEPPSEASSEDPKICFHPFLRSVQKIILYETKSVCEVD